MTEPLLPDATFVNRTGLVTEAMQRAALKAGKRRNIRETIVCPACFGTLTFSVSSNGHLWGKCGTEGCLEWMS